MTNTETAHGNSEAVTRLVEMTVKPEHEQEFLDYVPTFMEKVHANEPGTLVYVLTRRPGAEPHTYLFIERYRDQEAQQAHMEAPYMLEPISRAQDPEWKWWAKPPELLLQLAQVLPE